MSRSLSSAPPTAVALIGVGGFGAIHLRHLRTLEAEGLVRLVAVADPFPERSGELRAELLTRGVHWHQDYRDLFAGEERLDLVVIAAPIHLHEAMARAALADTQAAILLEKPPVPTLGQLHALLEADRHARFHVGFQMVAYPAVRQLVAWIRAGRLGQLRRITTGAVWPRADQYYQRASWAGRMLTDRGEPVFDGPATNALSHLAHLVTLIGGAEANRFARVAEVRGEFYRARKIESYDAVCLTGRLDSGVEFAFASAHCSRQEQPFSLRVEGATGWAEISDDGHRLRSSFAAAEDFESQHTAAFHRETVLRVRSHQPPLTSLSDCLGYSELTCGGLLSSGGIHPIADGWVDWGEEKPERICHVSGMAEAVARTIQTGEDWSAQGTPWSFAGAEMLTAEALSSRPFSLRDLTHARSDQATDQQAA